MPARPTSPAAQFSAILSRFPPEIASLARRCLPGLRRVFPGSIQLVYDYPHALVVAFGMSERGSEAVVAMAIDPRRVRLYFDKSLPDPTGLLEGAGGKVRSVTVAAPSDLDRADIRALIRAAIRHAGITFPRGRPIRVVFKSGANKRRVRKAAGAKRTSSAS